MIDLPDDDEPVMVVEGDCLDVLRTLPDGCVDVVVTDPPYPCIKREYGYWTEKEWFALMDPVVAECRRVLKPMGSAVFILQPSSEICFRTTLLVSRYGGSFWGYLAGGGA